MSMLKAVKSGVVMVDGEPHEVEAGKTFWSRDCVELRDPVVAALFGLRGSPALGSPRRPARRSAPVSSPLGGRTAGLKSEPWRLGASAAPKKRQPRHLPKMVKGTPRLTVALSSSAYRTIDDECYATTRVDGRETGGWLFAAPSRGTTVHVQIARGPHAKAKRAASSFEPVGDYLAEEEQFARSGADHLCRIGEWHSHTGIDAEPSEADLEAWVSCFKRANDMHNVRYYVGLIAAEDRVRGWTRPQLRAYVISRDERFSERILCEPAAITKGSS